MVAGQELSVLNWDGIFLFQGPDYNLFTKLTGLCNIMVSKERLSTIFRTPICRQNVLGISPETMYYFKYLKAKNSL